MTYFIEVNAEMNDLLITKIKNLIKIYIIRIKKELPISNQLSANVKHHISNIIAQKGCTKKMK